MSKYTTDRIFDFPVIKLRLFLRRHKTALITINDIEGYFDLERLEAEKLVNYLVKNGFVEKIDYADGWILSTIGTLFIHTPLKKPIFWEKTKTMIRKVIERILEVNINDYYLFSIEEAYLYGEFLKPEKNPLDSIEILVKLKTKQKSRELEDERMAQLAKSHHTFIERLYLQKYEILNFLKSRQHNMYFNFLSSEEDHLSKNYIQIYPPDKQMASLL